MKRHDKVRIRGLDLKGEVLEVMRGLVIVRTTTEGDMIFALNQLIKLPAKEVLNIVKH